MKDKDLIGIGNIVFENSLGSKEEVIGILADLLWKSEIVRDKEGFIEDILERENRGSTFVGEYLAIPHGFSNQVKRPSLAIAKTDRPFSWGEDEYKVRLVILFAIPEDDEFEEELEVLKTIAASLGDADLIKDLLNSKTREELIYTLEEYIR